jgi:S-adenosylmethionine hydrolase
MSDKPIDDRERTVGGPRPLAVKCQSPRIFTLQPAIRRLRSCRAHPRQSGFDAPQGLNYNRDPLREMGKGQLIVLLTDFGYADVYVGVMKGVCAEISPQTAVVDLTHGIPQGDIRQAAFKLWSAVPYFPDGTVFVIVVDPGVGTARQPIAAKWGGYFFVAPDNGVLSYLFIDSPPQRAVEISNREYWLENVSATFHGRDIFAPAGAHLAAGVPLEALGASASDLVRIPPPALSLLPPARLKGEVLYGDHFGNLVTSIGRLRYRGEELRFDPWLPGVEGLDLLEDQPMVVLPTGERLQLRRTFGAVPPGAPLAYVGSTGMLEIAVNQGDAARTLNIRPGEEIVMEGMD